jgi:hypothetical protein
MVTNLMCKTTVRNQYTHSPNIWTTNDQQSSPTGFLYGNTTVEYPIKCLEAYSFVNRTIRNWNQLPEEALETFPCKPKVFRKRFKKAVINGVK